jgi:hypothetical protein
VLSASPALAQPINAPIPRADASSMLNNRFFIKYCSPYFGDANYNVSCATGCFKRFHIFVAFFYFSGTIMNSY